MILKLLEQRIIVTFIYFASDATSDK